MSDSDITSLSTRQSRVFGMQVNAPGILVAYAPKGAVTADRCLAGTPFTVGRSSGCDLPLNDDKVSKRHFTLTLGGSGFVIEDLGSTNGTFVNGVRLIGKGPCPDAAVIRIGKEVLVFHTNAGPMLDPPPAKRFGLIGPFYTGTIVQGLMEAAHSRRHVLLTGPSGAGKELAVSALSEMLGQDAPLPVLDYNAARFTSEDEATATLFGVAPRVFSNVDPRPGLIELAGGGVLFLDEVHNLPTRVQRTLLRTIEDGRFARIGESKSRPADVRFVLASNECGPQFGLAHDLLARLRVIVIPALRERVADIPEIFLCTLRSYLQDNALNVEWLSSLLNADHFEAMCLDGFQERNVRGILDLADQLTSKIITGVNPKSAVASVFAERFGLGLVARRHADGPISQTERHREGDRPVTSTLPMQPTTDIDEKTSHYEVNKEQITTAYRRCGGNLTATERMLRSAGIRCTRRWLGIFIKKWGSR